MRYLSVCSGIEAATVAWHDLGWQPVAFSEIEPFPSAVLKHHYSDVPNVGDMTKYKEWDIGTIDLLVGGTPCQSFSVAGLRKGLEDPRGNLALVYCGILDRFKPKWFVWENVPGVLSSNGGRDFGSFLGAVAELGYGFAYRVLDAQYFGVAQRRRRVFVVGCLGDWRSAAEVLFEPESLRRDSPPSREKGQAASTSFVPSVASCLETTSHDYSRADGFNMIAAPIALAENTIGRQPQNGGNGDGFTVGGPMYTLNATGVHGVAQPVYELHSQDSRVTELKDVCGTVSATYGMGGGNVPVTIQPIAFEPGKLKRLGYGYAPAGLAPTLRAGAGDNQLAIAQPTVLMDQGGSVMSVLEDGTVGTLRRETHGHEPVVMAPTLTASNDPSRSPQSTEVTNQVAAVHAASMAVRRLTPVECERLQGFPDNYTNITWRKQPESPDGPRYKALGNSMAVPVMAWIGRRIANVA